jgi:hypothetical protein
VARASCASVHRAEHSLLYGAHRCTVLCAEGETAELCAGKSGGPAGVSGHVDLEQLFRSAPPVSPLVGPLVTAASAPTRVRCTECSRPPAGVSLQLPRSGLCAALPRRTSAARCWVLQEAAAPPVRNLLFENDNEFAESQPCLPSPFQLECAAASSLSGVPYLPRLRIDLLSVSTRA